MFDSGDTPPLPSRIAALVHAHFDALPQRSKPHVYPDGSREWIPMTGIVAVLSRSGAKCLSASHIPRCRGLVLHDCHAEILAIRAFNYWLLTECHGLLAEEKITDPSIQTDSQPNKTQPPSSPFIRKRERRNDTQTPENSTEWPPFELQPGLKLYMYCTCAPCGDASMELCMASQEDATPWEVVRESSSARSHEEMLDGRAHFSLLGIVRRKPARMDAESTRSKSCSDKLALRQVSSLLSCGTSRLVAPTESAYLAGLVLPADEINATGFERCFGERGRMKVLVGRTWAGRKEEGTIGYRFHPFEVLSVPAEEVEAQWAFAKPKNNIPVEEDGTESKAPPKSKPGNVSVIWVAAPSHAHSCAALSDTGSKSLPSLRRTTTGLFENIINGVKQGHRATTPVVRGASSLSRAKLWALVRNIAQPSACDDLGISGTGLADDTVLHSFQQRVLKPSTYGDFKLVESNSVDPLGVRQEAMREAKSVLKGWVRNSGDESWGLDVLVDPQKRKR
ncbi:hypothetical protein N7532_010566 [Penicillium argentinense]|uniref:A to I editase domain-containing protein n=1 Tax=Penicillium argentinense TaxID=1131581 RepID=A0A9W9EQ29_9EURO|nr:uncharacterized protein N7532_010566 [Penicillium argentinense]KAJ5085795.1 hypothetical protein N7532_010566 [Penicillium argentinense]